MTHCAGGCSVVKTMVIPARFRNSVKSALGGILVSFAGFR